MEEQQLLHLSAAQPQPTSLLYTIKVHEEGSIPSSRNGHSRAGSVGVRAKDSTLAGGRPASCYRLGLAALVVVYALAVLCIANYLYTDQAYVSSSGVRVQLHLGGAHSSPGTAAKDTLVLYIFADTEAEAFPNLRYFVNHAMRENDRCEYLIVVQITPNTKASKLPQLPSHAKYVLHNNECYDWGTIGWVLQSSGLVDITSYRYFVFMNSSVRGPFLPSYAQDLHWTQPFLERLNDQVKLVGPTISCEACMLDMHRGSPVRHNPHVQSYFLATDQVGLQVLVKDGHALQCHKNRFDAVYHGEVGSSLAILQAGYNLDSLLRRYQGVDWLDVTNWSCNNGSSPLNEHSYDGVSIDPYEVVFIKVKQYMVEAGISYAAKAAKLTAWEDDARDVATNDYAAVGPKTRTQQILQAMVVGSSCFDVAYYKRNNPDLVQGLPDIPDQGLWLHFLLNGQFEYRPFRWKCHTDWQQLENLLRRWPASQIQKLHDAVASFNLVLQKASRSTTLPQQHARPPAHDPTEATVVHGSDPSLRMLSPTLLAADNRVDAISGTKQTTVPDASALSLSTTTRLMSLTSPLTINGAATSVTSISAATIEALSPSMAAQLMSVDPPPAVPSTATSSPSVPVVTADVSTLSPPTIPPPGTTTSLGPMPVIAGDLASSPLAGSAAAGLENPPVATSGRGSDPAHQPHPELQGTNVEDLDLLHMHNVGSLPRSALLQKPPTSSGRPATINSPEVLGSVKDIVRMHQGSAGSSAESRQPPYPPRWEAAAQ